MFLQQSYTNWFWFREENLQRKIYKHHYTFSLIVIAFKIIINIFKYIKRLLNRLYNTDIKKLFVQEGWILFNNHFDT